SLISAEHAFTLMPGLGLDGVLGHIRGVGTRHEPRPQAVSTERCRIKTGAPSGPLDDQAHRVVGEAARAYIAVLAEWSEDGTFCDVGSFEPCIERAHWARFGPSTAGNANVFGRALLIRFAASERDNYPF